MILRYGEIIGSVLEALGLTTSSVDTNELAEIKRRINAVQDYIVYKRAWNWRRRPFYLTTLAPYETGTVDFTQASNAITGYSTVWTDEYIYGYLRKDDINYKIKSISSNTALKLEAKFPKDTESAASYKLVFPEYVLNPNIASIIKVKRNGYDLEGKTPERLLAQNAMGAPVEWGIIGSTDKVFYDTGTVEVTNGSTTVTGTSTNFQSYMEGMTFRVNEFSEFYVIDSVDSTTQLTLRSSYNGDSGSGKSYQINPVGQPLIRFGYIPDDYYWLTLDCLIKPSPLVNNTDLSIIPNHAPLLHGAIWFALHDKQDKNPVRIQQAKADFKETLQQLVDSHSKVDGVVWESPDERRIRQSGSLGNYDPFSHK